MKMIRQLIIHSFDISPQFVENFTKCIVDKMGIDISDIFVSQTNNTAQWFNSYDGSVLLVDEDFIKECMESKSCRLKSIEYSNVMVEDILTSKIRNISFPSDDLYAIIQYMSGREWKPVTIVHKNLTRSDAENIAPKYKNNGIMFQEIDSTFGIAIE